MSIQGCGPCCISTQLGHSLLAVLQARPAHGSSRLSSHLLGPYDLSLCMQSPLHSPIPIAFCSAPGRPCTSSNWDLQRCCSAAHVLPQPRSASLAQDCTLPSWQYPTEGAWPLEKDLKPGLTPSPPDAACKCPAPPGWQGVSHPGSGRPRRRCWPPAGCPGPASCLPWPPAGWGGARLAPGLCCQAAAAVLVSGRKDLSVLTLAMAPMLDMIRLARSQAVLNDAPQCPQWLSVAPHHQHMS